MRPAGTRRRDAVKWGFMKRAARFLLALAAAGAVLASRASHGASSAVVRKDAVVPTLQLVPLASGLTGITAITNAGDGRLFVTLQRGQIVIWDGTQILPTPFLDIAPLIVCCGEQGLLSTAFHPNYAVNGFFFVNYTDQTGQTIVARYHVSPFDRNTADSFSGVTLLTIPQPYTNHNGGQLQFGPDGDLYIGMGDGGSGNDPQCHAQSSDSLLGKMLRIDVDQNVNQAPYYGIPAENPYVSTTGPLEAWAYGLRNPWRFSFDRLTGDLYIGDVGQDAREEIDYQPLTSGGGQNYGWKIMEGTLCGGGGNAGMHEPGGRVRRPLVHAARPRIRPQRRALRGDRRIRVPRLGDPRPRRPLPVRRLLLGPDLGGVAAAGNLVFHAARDQPARRDDLRRRLERRAVRRAPPTARCTSSRRRSLLPPTIDSIDPPSGFTRGGEPVAITGTNFTSQTRVYFGALPATVVVQSPTALLATTPPHPAGLVDVTVVNNGATPAVRTLAFGYLPISLVPTPGGRVPRVVARP